MDEAGRSRRKRLVIHAGLGKTGSSAIQKYCRDHAQELRAAGALYLGLFLERAAPSASDFPSSLALLDALETGEAGIEDRLVALLSEKIASRPGFQTFVWSQIALATHADVLGRVIARIAHLCDVEVILYFRHQAEWLVSAYLQWGVRHKTEPGPIKPFTTWLPHAASRGSDYRAVIEGWVAAVGRERLHLRSVAPGDDVVADFLRTARLGVHEETAPTRHYETPDPAVMTLFRLRNGQHDDPAEPGALHRLIVDSGVDGQRYRPVSPASTLPIGDDWARFVASFAAENAAIARDFGLSLSPPVDAPPADPVDAAPATTIPVLLDLILALDRRIAALETALKRRG